MTATLRAVIRRDLLLSWRRRSDVATAVLFFVIVVSLFPLAIGPEPNLLRAIAPGIIWVAALLACMLSLTRTFESDHADGTLDQMLLAATPLGMIVIARVFAHWLVSGLPLVALAPVLSLVGAIGAALTLGLRGGGMLLALLVLPLYVPVLIIGAGALDAAAAGQSAHPHLLLLTALLVLAGAFAPWAISAALRISAE